MLRVYGTKIDIDPTAATPQHCLCPWSKYLLSGSLVYLPK